MWTKLSADKKSELMKAYKKGGFSYRDMIDDYNNSYEEFEKGGKVEFNSGGETHVVYRKESPTGNGKGIEGHIMINHPTKDKGKWDTIDLTDISNYKVKTIDQGIASTKKWHAENPEYKMGGIQRFQPGGEFKFEQAPGNTIPSSEFTNNDYNKLTKEQLDILKRQGNLDVVKKWYDENPEDMEGFNQWINTYNSSDLISKYQEKQAKFDEALKNSRDWNNEWYKKRATLPQFKDVATERLNTSNQLSTELSDPINLSIDWWNKTGKPPEVFYAPEIGGITRNGEAKININDIHAEDYEGNVKSTGSVLEHSYFTDSKGKIQSSLITHEENHGRDFFAPQIGTKKNVNKFKWGEGNDLDPIEKIITKEEQLNDPRNEGYSNSYQQQPTEVRSRLQVWRQINNIDPLKKYSNEEIDKIIKSNLNNPNINGNIKELLETLKNDPEKLNYLNNTYVSTNNKNQLPIAKMGGMIKRADGSYSKRGLWDNIRANAGSGKSPTADMLEQERKIKNKYEEGGKVNTLEGDLISKVIMNRNRNKDFVQRAYAVGEYPNSNMFVQPDANQFGDKNSHLMSYGEDDNGQSYMFPTIFNDRNEAVKVPNQYADYISSVGYKNATSIPTHMYGGIQKYQEGGIEESINKRLGNPMLKAEIDSDYKRPTVDPRTRRQTTSEPVDNVRHAAAGRYTQEAIENYANLIPYASAIPGFSKAAGFIGANVLGLGHEASTLLNKNDDDTRTMGMKVKESAADAYNNMIGSVIGASNLTPYQKNAYIKYLSETGKMPTGQYNKKKDPIYKKQTNKK